MKSRYLFPIIALGLYACDVVETSKDPCGTEYKPLSSDSTYVVISDQNLIDRTEEQIGSLEEAKEILDFTGDKRISRNELTDRKLLNQVEAQNREKARMQNLKAVQNRGKNKHR